MSPEQIPPRREPPPAPDPGRGDLASRPIAALLALLIPLLVVPAATLFVEVSPEDDGRLPLWAIEAFGASLLSTALAATTLPAPALVAYGLVPLLVPPLGALAGLGTVARWAALAGFCLIGAALGGLLGLGILLRLIAPGELPIALRLVLLSGLGAPLLALEACGCLLAASVAAPAGPADARARDDPRRWVTDSL